MSVNHLINLVQNGLIKLLFLNLYPVLFCCVFPLWPFYREHKTKQYLLKVCSTKLWGAFGNVFMLLQFWILSH